jgi:DNA polymerase-3 subunit delta'
VVAGSGNHAMTRIFRSPAYLWVGPHEQLVQRTITYLQTHWCVDGACGRCRICVGIATHQHHATTWLMPHKMYTLDEIGVIFSTISFVLEVESHHFFIIQKADLLTAACANSLLKVLEEPPTGYHFILLTERVDQVLPTVRSRCIVDFVRGEKKYEEENELFRYFVSEKSENPVEFLKVLDQSKIGEQESVDLLDRLLTYWITCSKKGLLERKKSKFEHAEKIVTVLKNAYECLPMPGSSKLFWKSIYLQMVDR